VEGRETKGRQVWVKKDREKTKKINEIRRIEQ
jgi:hypothetical protein